MSESAAQPKQTPQLSVGRRIFATGRVWHRRAALVISLPLLITIITGLLLIARGDFEWVQPKTRTGSVALSSPLFTHEALLTKLKALPEAEVKSWKDVGSVIFNPGKGVYQVRLKNDFEFQFDASNGDLLHHQFRLSGVLQKFHEGDFFHPVVRKAVFLPSGLILLSLWLSGLYLFFFPKLQKANKKANPKSA
jgi:hypothetical protein